MTHTTPKTRSTVRPHELRITRQAWEAAMRPMLAELGRFAVGPMRWLSGEQGRNVLVDSIEVVSELPSGTARPPMSDWAALLVEHAGRSGWSARDFLRRLRPARSQTLAAVVIYPGAPPAWDAVVQKEDGQVVPVAAIQVVGSAMLRLRHGTDDAHEPPDDESRQRWSRTRGALGDRVVDKLRNMSITLVGCGRNGSLAAHQLAALGVRQMRLVDGDTVEMHNLDAAVGLTRADVGRCKVQAVADWLVRFRPDLAVSCITAGVTDIEVGRMLRRLPADLFVTTVDSDAARLATSLLARDTLTIHLDVGTAVTWNGPDGLSLTGDARLLLPGQGCIACVGDLADQERTLYELASPPEALRRGDPQLWHEQRAGSLITLNALTVSAGVQMWIDLVAGRLRSSAWQRLRWRPGEGIEADFALANADPDCRFCRG